MNFYLKKLIPRLQIRTARQNDFQKFLQAYRVILRLPLQPIVLRHLLQLLQRCSKYLLIQWKQPGLQMLEAMHKNSRHRFQLHQEFQTHVLCLHHLLG